jgi:hypothetical protein
MVRFLGPASTVEIECRYMFWGQTFPHSKCELVVVHIMVSFPSGSRESDQGAVERDTQLNNTSLEIPNLSVKENTQSERRKLCLVRFPEVCQPGP